VVRNALVEALVLSEAHVEAWGVTAVAAEMRRSVPKCSCTGGMGWITEVYETDACAILAVIIDGHVHEVCVLLKIDDPQLLENMRLPAIGA